MHATLAFFGGSFDPPHVGHVLAVHYLLLTGQAERVLVIPCANHPFGKGHAPFEHRLAMCRLATRELGEAVEVLDIEARREGPSYTIDTVRDLERLYPEARLKMVVGSDIPPEIPQWKDSAALMQRVELLTLPRQGFPPEEDSESFFGLPEVSSTEIRKMLVGREAGLTERVPASVLDYIVSRELYLEG